MQCKYDLNSALHLKTYHFLSINILVIKNLIQKIIIANTYKMKKKEKTNIKTINFILLKRH